MPTSFPRLSARSLLALAALLTAPGIAPAINGEHATAGIPIVTQSNDFCTSEGDSDVGVSLCDPYVNCSVSHYTCTVNPRTGYLNELYQSFCGGCQLSLQASLLPARSGMLETPIAAAVGAPAGEVERVSIGVGTVDADGGSLSPALSDDGRFVVFDSAATNLVAADTNGRRDVFIFDRVLRTTERVSVAGDGSEGDNDSIAGAVSADGRFVAFLSRATNLVALDTNGTSDVFVRDRQAGSTERVNVGPGGVEASGTSIRWGPTAGSWPDSRSDAAGYEWIADNTETAISADGRYVAFVSDATNLVASDPNGLPDVFVRDRQTATTIRISETDAGGELMPTTVGLQQAWRPRISISGTGRFVAFETAYAAVATDTNATADVYVRDLLTGDLALVSVDSAGQQGNGFSGWPSMSGDGRFVAFASDASNLAPADTNGTRDIFLRDRQAGTTTRVPNPTFSRTLAPAISRDGRWVAYTQPSGKQVYLFDAATGVRHTLSRAGPVSFGNGVALAATVNADGSVVAFASAASNLAAADGNGVDDVFVASGNLIFNGTFAAGAAYWQTFGIPAGQWEVSGGAIRFYRTGVQAVVLQPTYATVPANAPLDALLDIANTGGTRRRVSVLIHDSDFGDLSVCTFWLAPGASSQTYRMRTHTTRAWTNATLSIYAATIATDGHYVVDNVSLIGGAQSSAFRTDCVDPAAPAPPGGAEGGSMVANGDFSAGLASWGLYGALVSQVSGAVFEFYRPAPGTPAGVILQATSHALPSGDIVRAVFHLGNSSAVRKRVTVLLHDGNFSDLAACTFWIPPGQPLSGYEMRTATTKAWSNATVSVYAATIGADQWSRLDDVSFHRSPATAVVGTECIEPGG